MKKANKDIKAKQTRAKKDLPKLKKQLADLKKTKNRNENYMYSYADVQLSSGEIKFVSKQIEQLKLGGSISEKEIQKLSPGWTRDELIRLKEDDLKALMKENRQDIDKLEKLNKDPAYSRIKEAVAKDSNYFSTQYTSNYDKRNDKIKALRDQIRTTQLATKPLTKAQRDAIKADVLARTPKPNTAQSGPGQRPGGGTPAAASSKGPGGKLAPASFSNGKSYGRHSPEGDIVVVTYLDIPGNNDRSDQRIGNVKVKLEKVNGDPSCDNRPKTADLTAKTNASSKTLTRKETDGRIIDKIIVHGTLNFKGCATGKYKVSFIGREHYKLRDGEDAVQMPVVEKDKSTEVVFTLVKK